MPHRVCSLHLSERDERDVGPSGGTAGVEDLDDGAEPDALVAADGDAVGVLRSRCSVRATWSRRTIVLPINTVSSDMTVIANGAVSSGVP
jgi:hypothetical protein